MIAIFGATSTIAKDAIKILSKRKENLYLFARNYEELEKIKNDIEIRFKTSVKIKMYDAQSKSYELKNIAENLKSEKIKGAIFFQGYMPKNDGINLDKSEIKKTNKINFESIKDICDELVSFKNLEFICAISSVASDFEKERTLYYGKSKANLSLYLKNLREKVAKNIRVIDIKLAPTKTKMTNGMKLPFGGENPEKIAKKIVEICEEKNDTIYIPFFWKYIMLLLKNMPKSIRNKF